MPNKQHTEQILILDFGSQYTQLIARCVREIGVYCSIQPCDLPNDQIARKAPTGIILSGGPESVTVEVAPKIPSAVFELNVPVLGICYGMQAMAKQLGGAVESSDRREFGHARIMLDWPQAPLIRGISDGSIDGREYLDVLMSHGDRVIGLPEGFRQVASASDAPSAAAAMMHGTKPLCGVQFHPEVTHTAQGRQILERFLFDLCGCHRRWTSEQAIDEIVDAIRDQVQPDEQVLLGLSGGVDSSVTAALLHRAIGSQLSCIFIDNGLLRQNEAETVMQAVSSLGDNGLQLDVRLVPAQDRFLDALAGVDEPEAKRKLIGKIFIEVFEEQAATIPQAAWFAQGTIYPDVIESAAAASGKAHAIKSHHNVGGLPQRLKLKLLEPLRMLFKDEVRRIGLSLGLPAALINRHPFPGPGLGVRILGEVRPEYAELLRAADAIFIEELRAANLYDDVSQAFAVFMPVRSVGVVGDRRRYEYVIALRAVETTDFMTAAWARLPHDFLGLVATRIMNELAAVSRVVYDISGKPPATIEWE